MKVTELLNALQRFPGGASVEAGGNLSVGGVPVLESGALVLEVEKGTKGAPGFSQVTGQPLEGEGAEVADGPTWGLSMGPEEYLRRYPEGKHADAARAVLGSE